MAAWQQQQKTGGKDGKAQARRKSSSSVGRSRAQRAALSRRAPGAGGGQYYRVGIRPKSEFVTFRTQDVGRKGHIQRVAGRRPSGSWATVTWLIAKEDAHVQNGRLVGDTAEAKQVIAQLGSPPLHTSGDRFKASDRPNVPERSKPTAAQRRARSANIRRAQAARRQKL